MKKQSIISSLTAAAVMLPAIGQASPDVDRQESPKTETKPRPSGKRFDINIPENTYPPPLCIDPRIQQILDMKVIKIFNIQGCGDGTNFITETTPTPSESVVDDVSSTTPGASESVVGDASTTTPTASESVVGDASATTPTASESVVGDAGATSPPASESAVGTDNAAATPGTDSEMSPTGESKADGDYDPHAIFGEDSKVFTRITKPVQNLFADVMFAMNKVSHHNSAYNLVPGSPDPMIDANTINAYFEIPFTAKMDIKASVGRDSVTAASPVFYTVTGASPGVVAPDTGSVKQSVTGASVKDQRNEGAVSLNYYGEKATVKIEGGASREYDYDSDFFGGNLDFDVGSNNTSLSIGSSYTKNNVIPDQLGAINPRVGGTNSNWQILGGVTQLVNNKTLVQFATTFFVDNGYLNDPYKPDFLPDNKQGWAFAGRYLHYIPTFHEAGLDLNYRYYTDGWGVRSSTFKGSLRLALPNGWGLEPGVRYYSQTGTNYYNLLTPPNVTPSSTFLYYTSDYRAASYGQVSGLLEVQKQYSATHTMYVGGSYGVRNASLRLGGEKITYPTEQEFTKITVASAYIGIKGVY